MKQDFERQLQQLLHAETERLPAQDFSRGVARRIARIKRLRLLGRTVAGVALITVAVVLSPFIVTTAGYVAEASAPLTAALGEVVGTPVAFAIGIATALYALLELRSS
jgi:hypothetical protein